MKIKAPLVSLPYDERIDGLFFQHSGETKIARVWRYPTSRSLFYFNWSNGLVLSLGAHYALQSPAIQAAWETYYTANNTYANCWPDQPPNTAYSTAEGGQRAYIVTNMYSQFADGTTEIVPVTPGFNVSGAQVKFRYITTGPAAVHPNTRRIGVDWSKAGTPVGISFLIHVFVAVTRTSVATTLSWPHFRWAGVVIAPIRTTVSVTLLLNRFRGVLPGMNYVLRGVLQQYHVPPLIVGTTNLKNA